MKKIKTFIFNNIILLMAIAFATTLFLTTELAYTAQLFAQLHNNDWWVFFGFGVVFLIFFIFLILLFAKKFFINQTFSIRIIKSLICMGVFLSIILTLTIIWGIHGNLLALLDQSTPNNIDIKNSTLLRRIEILWSINTGFIIAFAFYCFLLLTFRQALNQIFLLPSKTPKSFFNWKKLFFGKKETNKTPAEIKKSFYRHFDYDEFSS